MNTLLDDLSLTQRERLEEEFRSIRPTGWVVEIAHRRDWRAANEEFLRRERETGRLEMEHLMAVAGVARPAPPAVAADLVAAAVGLMVSPEEACESVERPSATLLRLRMCHCPTLRRLEANRWRGVTACGSAHRRRGWYEALGVAPSDSVLAESIWGDEACEALIDFEPAAFF